MVALFFLFASAIWVVVDAKSIGVRKGLVTGIGDMGPWGWFVATLGIWIVAFPSYLYYRGEFKKAIADHNSVGGGGAAAPTPVPAKLSGWAIAAFYVGFFSILVIPAPIAVFCGIMALRDIGANPTKCGKGRAIFGIIVGSLMMVIFAAGIISGTGQGHH